ncbi:MAG: tRNA pseudouridine(13) synthase TruD [Myxococcota bacterium]
MRVTTEPGSGGYAGASVEDFLVDEYLPYSPLNEGEHLFVRIQKRGLTTPEAIRRLLAAWGGPCPSGAVGSAGLKDRHAVATQWLSLPWPIKTPLPVPVESDDGALIVLQMARHPHKLRTGHVQRNLFDIRVRGTTRAGLERAQVVAHTLMARGAPMRFGPQRFGRRGDNVQTGLAWLQGGGRPPRDRRLRRLQESAVQAFAFNAVLDHRVSRGLWDRVLPGDLLKRADSGGLFISSEPEKDQARLRQLEVHGTGPIIGRRMRWPDGQAKALEESVVEGLGWTEALWSRLGPGTRRPLRARLDPPLSFTPTDDGYRVQFGLPAGGYATVVLDELVKPPDGPLVRAVDSPSDLASVPERPDDQR